MNKERDAGQFVTVCHSEFRRRAADVQSTRCGCNAGSAVEIAACFDEKSQKNDACDERLRKRPAEMKNGGRK